MAVELPYPLKKPVKTTVVPKEMVGSANSPVDWSSLLGKFEGKPPLPGFGRNVEVMLRKEFTSGWETKERIASFLTPESSEIANIARETCLYLASKGVTSFKILSNFPKFSETVISELKKEQTSEIRIVKAGDESGEVDVSVVLLLSCNGNWQQRKMCQLVQEAYQTAKKGVIMIGKEDIMQSFGNDAKWTELKAHLTRVGWNDHFTLICRQHKQLSVSNVYTAADLQQMQGSNGGCTKLCGTMNCGHVCRQLCHPNKDPDHKAELLCKEPCGKQCPWNHPCKKFCGESCGDCSEIMTVEACEHQRSGRNVSQVVCYQQAYKRCEEEVEKTLKCGHSVVVACWNEDPKCEELCKEKLKCGHTCDRPCHWDKTSGLEHEEMQCRKPCNRGCERECHPCPRQSEHLCYEECGPCKRIYRYVPSCGHGVTMRCNDPDPPEGSCKEPCRRRVPFCGHKCTKKCSEQCMPCLTVVKKKIKSCPDGHLMEFPCHIPAPDVCTKLLVAEDPPDCGHEVVFPCHEADAVDKTILAARCEEPCRQAFDKRGECGHQCVGHCGDCLNGRFHERCVEACDKILICGHTCQSPCGKACPPCRQPCFRACKHTECELECGVPCELDCKLPCLYECRHSKCTNLCSEICNKSICEEPCPETLSCGHPCVGFCGEECPPHCRICNEDMLLNGVLSGDTQIDPNDRFIYLRRCGHSVESSALEAWLCAKQEEIMPLRCPICRERLSWIHRYSAHFTENFNLINSVREKIFGAKEEIESILKDVQEKREEMENVPRNWPANSNGIIKKIFSAIDGGVVAEAAEKKRSQYSIDVNTARFYQSVCEDWISVMATLRDLRAKIKKKHYLSLLEFWKVYFVDMLGDEGRSFPIHPNELKQLKQERKRLEDAISLYTKLTVKTEFLTTARGKKLFEAARKELKLQKRYTNDLRANVLTALRGIDGMLNITLQVTEKERVAIVAAFGASTGRWFKCENGHIYVITECGGAQEVAKCIECGALIGGENHAVVPGNLLATEFDGAEVPLYPTALHNEEAFTDDTN